MDLPRERAMIFCTGSQGEPMSALARIAVDKHRYVHLDDGDLVIHSAREIPGNEKSIGRMIDHLMRRGASVVTSRDAMVHASGHPSQDELTRLIELVRPRYLVPIHGEYRQLKSHYDLARRCGLSAESVVLAESGDVIAVDERGIAIVDRVQVGQVFIDAALEEVDEAVLRDRRRSAWDGIVVAVVAVDRDAGEIGDYPQIVTRGFVDDADGGGTLARDARRIVSRALADATPEERRDEAVLKAKIHTELKRFLRRSVQRTPLIIPVIVEL
jgi:ribonuclease J